MSVEAFKEKRRKRRVAADEAHSWARNLRLGNPYAKLVLGMLTLYVNGDGACFVGIEQLADDSELSADTVRKRLGWLEQIGAVARFPRWIDVAGRCNNEGRGKRTSDEIRLLLDADEDEIEARAKGTFDERSEVDAASAGEISPRFQPGLNPGQHPVSPRPALGQPSESGEGLTSEPEPEQNPPNPPAGGGRAIDQELEADIESFRAAYPAPITDMPRFRSVMLALNRAERRQVITAAKGYASFIADLEKRGRGRNVKNAHLWVANGLWQGYLVSGEKAAAMAVAEMVAVDSDVGKAFAALHRIAHLTPLESVGRYYVPRPLTPQALALSQAPPEAAWVFIAAEDANQCGAWNALLREALAGKPRGELVWDRNPGGRKGFMAPWRWPPRKDGSISTGPPASGGLMSDDDCKDFK